MRARVNGETESGISLIEVVVAFTVLLITMVPIAYLLTSTVSSAATARQREAALQLADSWMEILTNSTPPVNSSGVVITNTPTTPTLPAGAQTPKSSLADGTSFKVTANYTLQSVVNVGDTDLCSGGNPGVIQLQVTITWGDGQTLTDTTNVDYPQPGLQTEGYISLQLTNNSSTDTAGNSSASRLQALPVTITDTSVTPNTTTTLYPDSNGCVFAQVPTGTYSVSVGQPTSGTPSSADFTGYTGTPAFVTTTGATAGTASSQIVTVTATKTVTLTNTTQNAFDEGIKTSFSYGGSAAVDGGVECPGTTSLTCLTLGNGSTTGSAAWGGTGATWSSTNLSGVTNLSQVACTSATTPTCVGVGYHASGTTSTGVIVTTSSDLGTTSTDTVPSGVTDVQQVVCPTANGCYALANTATGPVLLAGAVGQTAPQQDTWRIVTPLTTVFTNLASITCPASTTCEVAESATVGILPSAAAILRLTGDPATLATNSSWTPTFSTDTLPSTVSSVSQIACASSSDCEALAVSSSVPTVLTTCPTTATCSGDTTPPTAWSVESTFPSTAGSLTGLSCVSTNCVAIGTLSGSSATAAVWTADLTQSPHDWAQISNNILNINAISAVTSVACGYPPTVDTASCAIGAATTSASTPGRLLIGTLTGGAWSWNPATTSSNTSVLYYSGVACESPPSSSNQACAAVGATASGPIILTSATGPAGSWSVQTPSSLPGATVSGIPLETTPASISNWTTQVAAVTGQANTTSFSNPLYPQPGGYSIAAGDCDTTPPSTWISSFSAQPGGTGSTTVPLGLLPLQVDSVLGVPMSGATVTLTSTSCTSSDKYTLPTTDAYGYTRTAVPYGTYSYTVTSSLGVVTAATGVTITVNGSTIGVTTAPSTTAVTTYLPTPAVVVP